MSLVHSRLSSGGGDPNSRAVTIAGATPSGVVQTISRTSSLDAPNLQLSGHTGEVLACRFDPTGRIIASATFDRGLYLWNVYGGCDNFAHIPHAHKSAILEVDFHDGAQLATASADHTAALFDTATGERVKRFKGHRDHVNSVAVQPGSGSSRAVVATCGDDGELRIWDARLANRDACAATLPHRYQATSVVWGARDSMREVIMGSLDGSLRVYDIRSLVPVDDATGEVAPVMVLSEHNDMVTCVRVARGCPDRVFSFGVDDVVRVWDTRAFVPPRQQQQQSGALLPERCVGVLSGARCHGAVERNLVRFAVSRDGARVVCGGADRTTTVWQLDPMTGTGRVQYKLPGHKGSVNEVDLHPTEPVVVSASTDRTLFLGEIAA